MVKITVSVDGMACNMCEAHVNDAVRKAFKVKKVTSSHKKRVTEIISEQAVDEQLLREAITNGGYTVGDIKVEPYEKKGFLFFGKK